MKTTTAQKKIRQFKKFEKSLIRLRNKAQNERSKVNTLIDVAEARLNTLHQRADKFNREIKALDGELTTKRSELISSLSTTELDKHLDEI
jgi:chromosome segregation ATPase